MFDYQAETQKWLHDERQRFTQESQKNNRRPKPFIGERGYPHFDSPIHLLDKSQISQLAQSFSKSQSILTWPFLPFIQRKDAQRRFRWVPDDYSPLSRDQKHLTHLKTRPITYASHRDAALFAFAGHLINPAYERTLGLLALEESVLAYRSINGQNNVDFALHAFRRLEARDDWAVIFIDVKDFFGTIPHSLITTNLERILGGNVPPELAYILKNLMNYRYASNDTVIKTLKANGLSYLIRTTSRGFKICKSEDFRRYIDNDDIIKKNRKDSGIPQGSPISGLIANIAMLGFDEKMAALVSKFADGLFQRYSDDIVLICPKSDVQEIYDTAISAIRSMGMTISHHKTEAFARTDNKITNITPELESGANGKRQNMQYLGLEWNGEQIVLRPGTVGKRARPKNKPEDPKFWRYHSQSAKKVGDKALVRQANRMHKTINRIQAKRKGLLAPAPEVLPD